MSSVAARRVVFEVGPVLGRVLALFADEPSFDAIPGDAVVGNQVTRIGDG